MSAQLELFRLPSIAGVAKAQLQHILLSGRIVTYDLRRDRRRLALRIDERGLRVGAPRNVPLAEIEAFIRQHDVWVLDKLDAYARHVAPRHVAIHEGARLPLLGREVSIRVTAGGNRGLWQGDELWLAARPGSDLAALARRALQRRALEHFRPRLAHVVGQLGRPQPLLALSSARTRWGSCSVRSGIRLNWRMIHLPPEPVDYVIAHEAAHLVEMNHGARFWRVVETLCPEWQAARELLKRLGPGLPLI
jgi:predicted metal-dependent hydrolase